MALVVLLVSTCDPIAETTAVTESSLTEYGEEREPAFPRKIRYPVTSDELLRFDPSNLMAVEDDQAKETAEAELESNAQTAIERNRVFISGLVGWG